MSDDKETNRPSQPAIVPLLKLMSQSGASDLFITAGISPRMKINGAFKTVQQQALSAEQSRHLVLGVMNPEQRRDFENNKECNFGLTIKGLGRFRISAFVQLDTPGMVVRRIETQIPSFTDLKLPKLMPELSLEERGLICIVGATGTGKSTTIAAIVGHRNSQTDGHIVCIEDPVEYIHQHQRCIITQREVGIDTQSYPVALKNALRQSPDTLVIGEVRTRETMEHALSFAETGHLCITSLHASNATQALERIVNFYPKDQRPQVLFDLSTNLKAIVAQQLVPTIDGDGQRVAVEVLLNTPLVADLIRKGELNKLPDVVRRSEENGMQTFDKALYELYRDEIISYEDALRYASSENELRLMIKLGGEAPDIM